MSGPLDGVRVLDLSIALTGPYAAALMADQGASVIKVERPGIGDIARWVGVSVNGMSSLYLVCNRGKRSIAVDLQTPAGLDIVRRLAADTDVLIQNFRPGVMDKLGLGYDDVRAINGDVVYVSLSGFGTTGPYRDRSAYDTVIQAYGGLAANQSDPADGIPVFLRQTAADKVTALYAAQAISAALYARERGKGGQHIELSMMDAVVSFLWADSAANEVLLEADGSQLSSFVAAFRPLRFSDGWGIVTPTSDHDFAGMCRALDVDGYDDPRVRDDRRAHEEPRGDGGDHRAVLRARRVAQHGGRERALRGRARPVRDDPLPRRAPRRPARGRGRIVRAPRPSRRREDAPAPPSRAVRRDPGVVDRQFPGAR